MDILEKIRQQYTAMSRARRRIADVILKNPARCSFYPLKTLAAEAAVTEVTVLNFCRALGYASFVELKKELQNHILTSTPAHQRASMAAALSNSQEELVREVMHAQQEAYRQAFEQNTLDQMLRFVAMVRQAGQVFVAASNAGGVPGDYFIRKMGWAGRQVFALDLYDTSRAFALLTGQPPKKTLLVAVSFSPYSRRTLGVAQFCRAEGIPVAAITDRAAAPLAAVADTALVCSTSVLGLTNSCSAMLAMIDVLAVLYSFERRGEAGPAEAGSYQAFCRFLQEDAEKAPPL